MPEHLSWIHDFSLKKKKNTFAEVHLFWRLINHSYPIYAITPNYLLSECIWNDKALQSKTPWITQYFINATHFLISVAHYSLSITDPLIV